jgi:transcriptional regulator with PAS, ATPase and Fis domain
MTSFLLKTAPNEEQTEVVSELNSILEKMGCSISLDELSDEGRAFHVMRLKVNSDTAAEYNRRNAGRKPKTVAGDRWGLEVGHVRQMLETKTADEVAAELGISRSTLFRRLKDKHDLQLF